MSLATRTSRTVKWCLRGNLRLFSTKILGQNAPETIKKEMPSGRHPNNPILELRNVYPEFLPNPNPYWRNGLREKLERSDMMKRRSRINIPEFHIGSIMAVTISHPHQSTAKTNRFVGICIERKGSGLSAQFTLRNTVDFQGVEMRYELYDPTIQRIQVLRLQKRLDKNLLYLRDAFPEYSTFPFETDPEILPEGTPVPLNPVQVRLKPRPWLERWECQDLKGVSNIDEHLREKDIVRRDNRRTPWEKYDLMKQYRETIPEEEQSEIWGEVCKELQRLQLARKKMSKKRTFSSPNTPKKQVGQAGMADV